MKDVSKSVKFTDIQVLERLNNQNKFQFEHLINNDKRNITLNKIKEMNKIMKEKHYFKEIKDKTDINEEMTVRIQMNEEILSKATLNRWYNHNEKLEPFVDVDTVCISKRKEIDFLFIIFWFIFIMKN